MKQEDAPRKYSFWYAGSRCLICAATFILFSIILLTIIFYLLKVPHGLEIVTWRSLSVAVLHSVVVPIVVYVADIFKSLFPWPFILVVLIAIALMVWGPDRIQEWLASAKLEIAGIIKYEGTKAPEAFRKELSDAQKAVERANKEIREAYESAAPYVSQLRERYGISAAAANLANQIANAIGSNCPNDFRLTIFISDFVFEDRLYQLTEYYDKTGCQKTTGKSGRTYSIRYGIIGRVWRSGVAEIEGELISAEDRKQLGKNPSGADLLRFIARRWGLTLEESVFVREYQSYGAIRIECGEKAVGLIYFDSRTQNAFGASRELIELEKKVQDVVEKSPLPTKMLELSREVKSWSRIRIFRNP